MTLELPWPPSTNTAYANVRGRRVKTKQAREYATRVQWACMDATRLGHHDPREAFADDARFAVHIEAHPPDRRRRDLGNLEKIAVDAIFDWLGHDDSAIDDLHITRAAPSKPGCIVVTITEANT